MGELLGAQGELLGLSTSNRTGETMSHPTQGPPSGSALPVGWSRQRL